MSIDSVVRPQFYHNQTREQLKEKTTMVSANLNRHAAPFGWYPDKYGGVFAGQKVEALAPRGASMKPPTTKPWEISRCWLFTHLRKLLAMWLSYFYC
ncbi:hypothetical protein GWI33_004103 [Rhynchophorus ferrugineus]|uniref:Uncharacterized protein n=1 Tax=Rhynchophorus ferrugineus TaxID=354439 RepID=A0A834IPV3_RHYFE|nr:hypothetical protein GWI33_004103 [Rhynchophorus ferrugineus]